MPLTFEQFRCSFANAVSEQETKELFETFAVPAPGASRFQVAFANLNPWTEVRVDTDNPGRGHALTIDSGWREVAETALAFVRRFA